MTGIVLQNFADCGFKQSGVMTEDGNGFLLTVVGLQHFRPFRPGIILRPCFRRLGHHLQLGHAGAAHADAGAYAVIARIATAYDDHFLALGVNGFPGAQHLLGGSRQEVHGEVNAFRIPPRKLQVPGLTGTATEQHRIIVLLQAGSIHIRAYFHAGDEGDAFIFHQLDAACNNLLIQLHVGNTIH